MDPINPDADSASLLGQVIAGRYRVLELLGEGGMGAIFVAEHLGLHKRVALKMVRAKHAGNEAAAARFAREAMVTAAIDHPNVISALDYGPLEDGGAFLAMQLVEGGTLTRLLGKEGTLAWPRAAALGAQVADAVMAAGKHGIVHRDLKPDNLLIQCNEDGSDLVKVLDFGIAKFSRDSLAPPAVQEAQRVTQTGMVVGTPGYMSPEQALGEPTDHRADLYSLGVLLWECIVGRRLWAGSSVKGIVRKQLKETPPRVLQYANDPTIPEPLDELIAMLTAREAEQRPSDIQAVRDLLRDMAESARACPSLPAPSIASLAARLETLRSDCPDGEKPVTTPSGVPQATPMTGGSDARSKRPQRARLAARASLFAVSVAAGLGFGLIGRTPDMSAAATDMEDQAEATQPVHTPLSAPAVGPTGLPRALEPQLATLVHAEGRTQRVAAAEALLSHMPVDQVPKYARLVAHLQLADTCPSKHKVVTSLAQLEDPRALPALVMMSQRGKSGCGPKNRDCLQCMREELDATITQLESKQRPRGPS